jgi:Bacterial type III secretion protein (HrpB4)
MAPLDMERHASKPAESSPQVHDGAPPRQAWAALLAAVQRRAEALHGEVHPLWREVCLGNHPLLAAPAAPLARRRVSALLLRRCGLRWPLLSALAPRPQRLALLPHSDTTRALAALAVFARPSIVRRCLSRTDADALKQCVGEPMYGVLARNERSTSLDANDEPIDLRPESLAQRGWEVLMAGTEPFDRDVAGLLALNLPPQPGRQAVQRMGSAAGVAGLCNEFFPHLADWMPELKWLFGFELDAANSVSITA